MTVQINETTMSAHTGTTRYEPYGFCANALQLLASGGIRLHNFFSHRPVKKKGVTIWDLLKQHLAPQAVHLQISGKNFSTVMPSTMTFWQ